MLVLGTESLSNLKTPFLSKFTCIFFSFSKGSRIFSEQDLKTLDTFSPRDVNYTRQKAHNYDPSTQEAKAEGLYEVSWPIQQDCPRNKARATTKAYNRYNT